MSHEKRLLIKNTIVRLFPGVVSSLAGYRVWALAGDQSQLAPQGETLNLRGSGPIKLEDTTISSLTEELSQFFSTHTPANPEVSIIIPVYGQIEYTLMCLQSISRFPGHASAEVIVVDDKSPDNSLDILRNIRGITLLENAENQGFIRTCNAGARAAAGHYLVFLNNDVEVEQGWLDELVATFRSIDNAGLVGAKLVYPDGRLQEAGGIIWNDGSAWNFGRNSNPDLPEFNYLRETDYCSGACIGIPKSLFEEVGGFDEHYLPAYAEDSDLAFKVRKAGKKVFYQPLSTVVHYEGVTSGTDTTQGVKAYQVENAKKLFHRWSDEIALLETPGENIPAAKDKNTIGRMLVLDHCTPTPDMDAGSITALNIMRLMVAHGYQVTFVPEDNLLYMPGYTHALQRIGIEVLYAPFVNSVRKHLESEGNRYDAVMLFRPLVADRHLDAIKRCCRHAKILYHASDLHFLRIQREAKLQGISAETQKNQAAAAKELSYFKRADAAIVHSTLEAEILAQEYGMTNIHIFPWAIDIRGTAVGFSQRADICFIGSYQHPPNTDAALYFIRDILPLILEQLPAARFHAIGSNPPDELTALQSDNVVVPGFISDLEAYLDTIRVAVAPLRYGAGIKGKIGTTLSLGVPCVATTVAAEGMQLTDTSNILVADDPAEFAAAVVRLYHSETQWQMLSENGIAFAEEMYGMSGGFKITGDILKAAGLPVSRTSAEVRALYNPPMTNPGVAPTAFPAQENPS